MKYSIIEMSCTVIVSKCETRFSKIPDICHHKVEIPLIYNHFFHSPFFLGFFSCTNAFVSYTNKRSKYLLNVNFWFIIFFSLSDMSLADFLRGNLPTTEEKEDSESEAPSFPVKWNTTAVTIPEDEHTIFAAVRYNDTHRIEQLLRQSIDVNIVHNCTSVYALSPDVFNGWQQGWETLCRWNKKTQRHFYQQ